MATALVADEDHVGAVGHARGVPAPVLVVRHELHHATAVVDGHLEALYLVRIGEHRQEEVVEAVAVWREAVGQPQLLVARLVLHHYVVAMLEALVAGRHGVGARVSDQIGGVGALVLPQVGGGVRLGGVQQEGGQLAEYAVVAELHGRLRVEVDGEEVALGPAAEVGDGHRVGARAVHRDGWPGGAVAPEIAQHVGLLHGEGGPVAEGVVMAHLEDGRGTTTMKVVVVSGQPS